MFVNSLCLVIDEGDVPDCVDADDPEGRLISASTDVFATDRSTAEAVNGEYLPAGAEEKEGLINKWPFDAEKKDYPYWDGLLGAPVDAVYDSTETLEGWRRTSTTWSSTRSRRGRRRRRGRVLAGQVPVDRPHDRLDHPPDPAGAARPRER